MRDRTIYKPFQVVTVEDLLRDSEFCQKYGGWLANIIGQDELTYDGIPSTGCILRRPGGEDISWDRTTGALTLQAGWVFLFAPKNDPEHSGIVQLTKPMTLGPGDEVLKGKACWVLMKLTDSMSAGDAVPRVYVDPATGGRIIRSEQVRETQMIAYKAVREFVDVQALLKQGYKMAFSLYDGVSKPIVGFFVLPQIVTDGRYATGVAEALEYIVWALNQTRGVPITQQLSFGSLAQVNKDIATINQRLSGHDTDLAFIKAQLGEITRITALDRIYVAKSNIQCGTQTWAVINHYDSIFARYAQIDNATGVIHLRAGTYLVSVSVDWLIATDAVVHFGVLTASGPDLVAEIPFWSSHRLFYRKSKWEFEQNTDIVLGVLADTPNLPVDIKADFEQVQPP